MKKAFFFIIHTLKSVQSHSTLIYFCLVWKVIILKGLSPPGTRFKAEKVCLTQVVMKEGTGVALSLRVTLPLFCHNCPTGP